MGTGGTFIEIGARLREVRELSGVETRKDWAAINGFNATQYTNWENGTRRIPVDAAERLCDRYGLTLDFIYRGRRNGLPQDYLRGFASKPVRLGQA